MTSLAPLLLLLKASVLLGAALLAAFALRQAPAARHHRLWSATFAAVLALPLLALTVPVIRVPISAWDVRAAESPATPRVVDAVPEPALTRASAPLPRPSTDLPRAGIVRERETAALPSTGQVLAGLWLAGAVAVLGALVLALARVRRLAASAREIDDPEWRRACARIAGQLGVSRAVRVLASSRVVTPLAGGVLRPTVFVPETAAGWSDELRDVVLAHEIAHLASRDPLRHLVARLAFTLYWFHPLAWLAVRRAVAACELACDEAVLALGIRPSTYAGALLHFADTAPRRLAGTALPIVRRSFLEARLVAILTSRPRPAARRGTLVPAAAVAALTLGLAALRPLAPAGAVEPATPPRLAGVVWPAPAEGAALAHAAGTAVPGRAVEPLTTQAPTPAPAAAGLASQRTCWSASPGGDFSGWLSTMERDGVTIVQQVGRLGSDRVIQQSFGDLRVCAVAEDFRAGGDAPPSAWGSRAARVVLETERQGDLRRMEIAGGRVSWWVNGASRPVDAAAEAWRERLLALLDATWDLTQLRGRVTSLRGQITSIYGERTSLRGEITSLRGQVTALRGQITAARGRDTGLRGEIASIRGHETALRGAITAERGAITSLTVRGGDRDAVSREVRAHEDEIRRLEGEIARYDAEARVREVERRIAALDTDREVADVERQIREFDVDGRVAEVERRLAGLDVERRVAAIEGQLAALDAERRGRELEGRVDQALERLRAVLGSR
ncbi:MAG TPA: M56 family metallopeptidase [Longimicrobium sp.]|jgi:beta-lactamase regulating signal transducer with metallopeptidase domain